LFKLQPVPLDKESWENVAPIVFKSFQITTTNIQSVKKLLEKQDERLSIAIDSHDELEGRHSEMEQRAEGIEEELATFKSDWKTSHIELQTQVDTLTQRLNQTMAVVGGLFQRLESTFAAVVEEVAEASPLDSESCDGRVGEEEEEEAAVAADEEVTCENDDASDNAASTMCLEGQLKGLSRTFVDWRSDRQAELRRHAATRSTVAELQDELGKTHDRLMTWRDLLKENSHMVDSLSTSLAGTQDAVEELQAMHMRRGDVEEAINVRAKQFEELHDATDGRMDGLVEKLDQHVQRTVESLSNAHKEMSDDLCQHNAHIAQLVEKSINPISAFMNTMHVNFDEARVDVDKLKLQVPELYSKISDVADEAGKIDDEWRNYTWMMCGRLEKLSVAAQDMGKRMTSSDEQLSVSMAGVRQECLDQIGLVQERLTHTTSDVEALRVESFAGLSNSLVELEQRVAKWIHAHPLPVKVSEARLYSLETRLAGETEARHNLERQMIPRRFIKPSMAKEDASSANATPRSGSLELPHLLIQQQGQQQQPLSGSGGGGAASRTGTGQRPRVSAAGPH